ncbi:MAG: hypothetical protein Q9227_000832 [Pyrenula ochraceoflavens]
MSSRALRRLQREQEEKRLEKANAEIDDGTDESEVEQPSAISKAPLNAFDMLNINEETNKSEDEHEQADEADADIDQEKSSETHGFSTQPSKPKSKKKKKSKQKKKANTNVQTGDHSEEKDDGMDEIDKALQDLAVKAPAKDVMNNDGGQSLSYAEWELRVGKLLSVEQKNLNPLTEMKSLFGNMALEQEDRRNNAPSRQRAPQQLDLGTALMGRYSPASKGEDLGSLASTRNCFLQGRTEWPRASSGGLSMEVTSSGETEIRQYTYQRNPAYQRIQTEYEMAVESMQPDQMIRLLQYNPYHISTLLQVSEIAKHQGDHSVAGDLLERALFTFGRSVHSTFSPALRTGLARLDFAKAPSREFFLAAWRFLTTLETRGTWRTAFEWAKLLLSLDPLSDPYGVTHVIDQLALRGRQPAQLVALCDSEAFGQTWSHLPNISISLTLAHLRSSPKLARQQLALAMRKYPYILCRLCSELDISPIPKAIWGEQPTTEAQKLYTELYATRAKDLWNTPETISLLIEVADTLESYDTGAAKDTPKLEVSLEDARHVFLTEKPALIALLPRQYKNMSYSPADPLPPPSPDSLGEEGLIYRAPGTADTNNSGMGIDLLRSVRGIGGANWLGAALNLFRRGSADAEGPPAVDEPPAQRPDSDSNPGIEETSRNQDESSRNQRAPTGFNQEAFAALEQAIEEAEAEADLEEEDEDWSNIPEDVREFILRDPTWQDLPRELRQEVLRDSSWGNVPEHLRMEIFRNIHRGTDDPETDDEEIGEVHNQEGPAATSNLETERPARAAASFPAGSEEHAGTREPIDPQRTQRHLLGKGLSDVQTFVGQHRGEIATLSEASPGPVRDYLTQLATLNVRERRWVLQMVRQRDREVGDLLDRFT